MTESLLQAYTPLLLWTGLGLVLVHFMPLAFPRLLGRGLYWVGVPVEIFALARQTDFSELAWLSPLFTGMALLVGMGLAVLGLWGQKRLASRPEKLLVNSSTPEPESFDFAAARKYRGSFILCSMLGNTGFVGLAIATALISNAHLSWAVFYAVSQNLLGAYGLGVFLASYFGRSSLENYWWIPLRDVLSVPSLWAFVAGLLSRSVAFPPTVESGLQTSVWVVIPLAFLPTGMRLRQLKGLKSFQVALVPALLKVLVLPVIMGLSTTVLGLSGEPRLALVLMSGMPTAFASLVLAEEYDLDWELTSSSIALSTIALLPLIPLWLIVFG